MLGRGKREIRRADLADCTAVEMQFGGVEKAQDRDDGLALEVGEIESYHFSTAVCSEDRCQRLAVRTQHHPVRLHMHRIRTP